MNIALIGIDGAVLLLRTPLAYHEIGRLPDILHIIGRSWVLESEPVLGRMGVATYAEIEKPMRLVERK